MALKETLDSILSSVQKGPVQIGRYKVTRKVGEGAFAYVFEGTFDEFERKKAAIKFPKTESAIPNIRTRQRLWSALADCPYTPNILDQGEYNGVIYFVEEFRAESLQDVITKNQSLQKKPTNDEIINVGRNLLKAIDYFHRLGETNKFAAVKLQTNCLVHCDIKPSNIMRTTDLTGDTVWQYTDFGVQTNEKGQQDEQGIKNSFLNSVSLDSIKRSGTGATPDVYAAPEVQRALLHQVAPPVTVASDLWGIGAVLFAYATGKAPSWGQTDPRSIRTDLPESLSSFFKTMLDGDPGKRPASAVLALKTLETSLSTFDSYIIGVGKREDGIYFVFSQPMQEGMPQGMLQKHFSNPDKISGIRYLSEGKELVYVSQTTDISTKNKTEFHIVRKKIDGSAGANSVLMVTWNAWETTMAGMNPKEMQRVRDMLMPDISRIWKDDASDLHCFEKAGARYKLQVVTEGINLTKRMQGGFNDNSYLTMQLKGVESAIWVAK